MFQGLLSARSTTVPLVTTTFPATTATLGGTAAGLTPLNSALAPAGLAALYSTAFATGTSTDGTLCGRSTGSGAATALYRTPVIPGLAPLDRAPAIVWLTALDGISGSCACPYSIGTAPVG